MSADIEKRTAIDGMAAPNDNGKGVEGRHSQAHRSVRGGGYLDNCTPPVFSNRGVEGGADNAHLDELMEMGLSRVWRKVAAEIGPAAFLRMWKVLTEDPDELDSAHRVYVPYFTSYMIYQRNRFIISLHENGLKPLEIRDRVRDSLGMDITTGHIRKLIFRHRRRYANAQVVRRV